MKSDALRAVAEQAKTVSMRQSEWKTPFERSTSKCAMPQAQRM